MSAIDTSPIKLPLIVTTRWLGEQGIGSRTTIWRKINDGTFPPPDAKLGTRLTWKRETIMDHMERRGLV